MLSKLAAVKNSPPRVSLLRVLFRTAETRTECLITSLAPVSWVYIRREWNANPADGSGETCSGSKRRILSLFPNPCSRTGVREGRSGNSTAASFCTGFEVCAGKIWRHKQTVDHAIREKSEEEQELSRYVC